MCSAFCSLLDPHAIRARSAAGRLRSSARISTNLGSKCGMVSPARVSQRIRSMVYLRPAPPYPALVAFHSFHSRLRLLRTVTCDRGPLHSSNPSRDSLLRTWHWNFSVNWLFVVKKRRPPEGRPMIVDLWSANTKLAPNRLRDHQPPTARPY